MGARWCHSLGEEFSAQKLHLTPSKAELLLQPQWNIPPCLWLFYRFFILLYTLSWCVYTGLLFNTPRWLICLANVSYCLMGLYYLVALINLVAAFAVVRRHCQTQKINYPGSLAVLPLPGCLGRSLVLQWFLHIAQGSLSLTVSALYWGVSFPASRHPLTAFSINLHVVNTLQTLLDCSLSAVPIHLGHCVYVLITGCLYILFVVPYWLAYAVDLRGEVYIYMVDFGERPATHVLITLALCVVCLPFFHFVLWNIGLVREAMAEDDGINPARWWWQKVGGIGYSPGAHFERDRSVFRISPSKEETAIIEQQTTYY